ncbi:MAG: hypothetical protein ACI4PO_04445 [Faecousia sp.]
MAYEQPDYSKMTREEALKRIAMDYPEDIRAAIQIILDGGDLVKFLSVLDSY